MYKWFCFFFLVAGTASADSSIVYIFSDGRGAMPMETDLISMEAESVSIVPTGDMVNQFIPEMEVTCVFYLRNTTSSPLDVSVGFPFESFGGRRNYTERDRRSYDQVIEDMSSEEAEKMMVDTMIPEWFEFRASAGLQEFEVAYERGVVNSEDRLVFWPVLACWQMHFEPGETVRLVNTYNTGWNYYGYSGTYEAAFTYIVRSGALWADRIGDAVISITMPDDYPLSMLSDTTGFWVDWNGSPQIDGNRVTWHFSDWEPVEDVVIISAGRTYLDARSFDRVQSLDENGEYCSFSESRLFTRWTAEELYPEALWIFSCLEEYLSAETITRILENGVYGMSGMRSEQPHKCFNSIYDIYGDPPFDAEKLEIVMGLQQHFAECRLVMNSAELGFLLPMAVLRRDWSRVNLEMYCADTRSQAAYLLFLENLEDAVMGVPVTDPAVESLFQLTGWFLPGRPTPMMRQFRDNHYHYYPASCTYHRTDSTVVSREEVRNFWKTGGGCDLPLVLSSCVSGDDLLQTTDLIIEVSSQLSSQAGNDYSALNLIDGDTETAWVEGIEGYGYGETICVSIPGDLTTTGFAARNGYCKSEDLWQENARIRKFLVSLNGSPFIVAEFEDSMELQTIEFPEIRSFNSDDILSFEIIEIYPGTVFQDAAVSELFLVME